jgi:flagellar hook-basal body complex protein FliE
MAVPITPITAPALAPQPTVSKPAAAAGDFSSMLSNAMGNMDQSTKAAAGSIDKFLSGENEEVHSMVLETQRNELQFELFLQVRNKMVQAYQEVMRMQM